MCHGSHPGVRWAMTDHDVLVFLLALAVLLASARFLGELARGVRLPLVVGEMAAGILLGPSGLGRVAPEVHRWLFAPGPPESMVGGYTTVAVVLLLVRVGMGVDLDIVRRRGRSALATGLLGIAFPLVGGVALGLLLPDSDLVDPSRRAIFALLLGIALSISALPVIAKTVLDLGLFKSDVGLLVMAAAMIDAVLGWLALSLILGPIRGSTFDAGSFVRTVVLGGIFVASTLVGGRRLIDWVLGRLARDGEGALGRVLSLVIVLALLGATATQAIGLHAVLGGFVVGLTIGRAGRVNARTRTVLEDLVAYVFAPVFFASIGLRIDFVSAFDLRLCLIVFVVATVPKLVGCTLGSRIGSGPAGGRLGWREAAAVGVGMNARGAMGVILATIARGAGLLNDPMFVALVVMALATSLTSGPAMRWLLYRQEPEEDVVTLLRRGAFVSELRSHTPTEAIGELVRALGSLLAGRKRMAREAVLERERVASTGLGDEVAIPHAAVEGLEKPLLALGRAPHGIDFDAPDGRPARVVFLLLIPPQAYDEEIRILASIARATFGAHAREDLAAASGLTEAVRVLAQSAKRTRERFRPRKEGAGAP
jgi:Kef-type K+ transport system membrane component KefB/mannitol/fructose-specific phosphotransferase system IIA component (Ntr-type)